MPSRKRPKAPKVPNGSSPTPSALTDAQRFAQSLRDSAEADRKAAQAEQERNAQQARVKAEAAEHADRLKRAQAAHLRAVEMVKEAKRTGKGAAAADLAWREAKAELVELETGKRPAWAAKPVEAEPPADDDSDAAEAEPEAVAD